MAKVILTLDKTEYIEVIDIFHHTKILFPSDTVQFELDRISDDLLELAVYSYDSKGVKNYVFDLVIREYTIKKIKPTEE